MTTATINIDEDFEIPAPLVDARWEYLTPTEGHKLNVLCFWAFTPDEDASPAVVARREADYALAEARTLGRLTVRMARAAVVARSPRKTSRRAPPIPVCRPRARSKATRRVRTASSTGTSGDPEPPRAAKTAKVQP